MYKQIMNGITIKGRISRLSGQEKLVHQLLNVVPLVIDNIYSISRSRNSEFLSNTSRFLIVNFNSYTQRERWYIIDNVVNISSQMIS